MIFKHSQSFQSIALSTNWRRSAQTYSLFIGLVAATTSVWLDAIPAMAQLSQTQTNNPTEATSATNVFFVNPGVGNDNTGNGTQASPWKTITQALRVAQTDTVILLTAGNYSTQTGEIFPIFLKPGVTIQGNPSSRGQEIIIRGGGEFLSRTAAGQNVAVVGADRATITGVTITNPNKRGYGLWIESTSPLVANNTFTESKHDGISVNGNSAPLVRNNYFYNNGGNGITIYGTSRPEVRDNVFLSTGFGISVTQNAAPRLINNRISNNKDGIVVEGSAQPVLRNNTINNNQRDGLVAIAQSLPDLGTASEPGGNIFTNNGEADIRNKTANQVIPAFGNQLTKRTEGRIDFAGLRPVASGRSLQVSSTQIPKLFERKPESPPLITASSSVSSKLNTQTDNNQIQETTGINKLSAIREISISAPTVNDSGSSAENNNFQIPAVAPASTVRSLPQRDSKRQLPVLNPNPIAQLGANQQPELLPVPSPNIPVGTINKSGNNSGSRNTNTVITRPASAIRSLRYRVVVEAPSSREEGIVRSLFPDAFHSTVNGRKVLQVGAYSDRSYAQEMMQMLNGKGLRGAIEQMN